MVKVWDVRQKSLSPSLSSPDQSAAFVKRRQINCLATTDDVVYWGDDGTNIKALDVRAGTNTDYSVILCWHKNDLSE